ncbi:hypothetical protein C8F01DRAFT_1122963 [Mycena amicta]|nr:hypothetical protein C8F01DRAFT_1122963 [Mycena amicta]
MSSLINEFPPELLSKVFVGLPYYSLLDAQLVSKRWSAVINGDSELLKLLFKKRTKVFLEANTTTYDEAGVCSASPEPVRLHPIVAHISFSIPGLRSLDDIYVDEQPLSEVQAADDFVSIPTVTRFIIKEGAFKDVAKNKKGVRVRDVFEAMVKQYKSGHGCVDSDFESGVAFDGFTNLKRTGLQITTRTEFGS